MTTDPQRTDLVELDRSINRAHLVVIGTMVVALATYLVWFWFLQSKTLSDQSDAWGQFGDFVGGVLNPLVAYSAFYWLTRSVRLQKEELLETRKALEDSSAAQTKQATYAQVSVRLSALTALINSIMVEVQTQRMQLQFIIDQASHHPSGSGRLLDGTFKNGQELQQHIAVLNDQISTRMTQHYAYEEEIKSLLELHR